MSLFERLKADAPAAWSAYVSHDFVKQLGDGDLPLSAFKTYLVQDYLFLIQYSRAYALAVYKSPTVDDMKVSLDGLNGIFSEMGLHLELCEGWGLSRADIEAAPELNQTMAYTRFVLEAGMAGDLLDLQTALAPCVVGYAEIGAALSAQTGDLIEKNPYRRWIEEYASEGYQDLARAFGAWMDRTADVYLTEQRYERLQQTFEKATWLEADFWQMGLDAK
ncbi:TENA/THI-4 family protein [Roseibium sp. TrichSKD4]|uniref:thiaminase II n=1 Tax=Roseibium sp. TrichSKD4 TaxID=744980 RepID=UPI0001E572E6|nr:thiaminase II [Roseibium sp. TrichSKD4]EFO29745.1 TENA/THI-4 family protein [Roseibium sp. TrichSKD4]